MRVLGIDTGYARAGWGVIDKLANKLTCVSYGCIETPKGLSDEERLVNIFNSLNSMIDEYSPEYVAVESLFYFKNQKTVIKVGQARGVILLACKLKGLPTMDLTPLQVKSGVTGYGKADKLQVQKMVKLILGMKEVVEPDDAADALAIAITYANSIK